MNISSKNINDFEKMKVTWTNKGPVSEVSAAQERERRLKEIELRHLQKLYDLDQNYYHNLQLQKLSIKERLRQRLTEHARTMLVARLREVEDEIIDYFPDDSKLRKVEEEMKLLRA
ncbi:hypothetical protein QQ008_01645 [Fulvivirgaceae bacterium BMA10]|uniref:Uncharacterized protein n=1 Tax=Splendidivirga corallicola TaxID=3051826 RepID=A0ABT8KH41_9BACT|nr:hypothetical protein [Fulvivirgaceae bacterium BMA10]